MRVLETLVIAISLHPSIRLFAGIIQDMALLRRPNVDIPPISAILQAANNHKEPLQCLSPFLPSVPRNQPLPLPPPPRTPRAARTARSTSSSRPLAAPAAPPSHPALTCARSAASRSPRDPRSVSPPPPLGGPARHSSSERRRVLYLQVKTRSP